MAGEEQLQQLKEWVESPEFLTLITAYPQHRLTGTKGTNMHKTTQSGICDDRGIIRPELFSRTMQDFKTRVLVTKEGMEIPHGQLDYIVPTVQETLEDMIGSVEFRDESIKRAFERGHEMGRALATYMAVTTPEIPDGTEFGVNNQEPKKRR